MSDEIDLPSGWSLARLGDVADATLGKTPRRADYQDNGGYRIVKYRDLKSGVVDFTETRDGYVANSPTALKGLRELRVGDVLIGASGHDGSTVGRKLAMVEDLPEPAPVFFVGEIFRIRPRAPESDPRWFLHYFSSEAGYRALQKAVTGGHLTNGRARQIPMPIAPPDVQRQISDLLDAVRDRTLAVSKHLNAARVVIERFRRAVLVGACAGRLTAGWRDAHPQLGQSADDLLRELRLQGGKSLDQGSSAQAVIDLPETWRVVTGAEAFVFVTSGSRGWAKFYSDEGPAFLRVGNLDRHRLDLDLASIQSVTPPPTAESSRTRVQPGDLLISITAEVGMVGVVPADLGEGYVNQHVAIARPHPQLNPRFLAAFVAAPAYGEAQLDALQRGATKAGLGLDDIKALSIPLPPAEEQMEIARGVDQFMSIADALEFRVYAASRRIDRSSQAVLAKAFRGEFAFADGGGIPKEP